MNTDLANVAITKTTTFCQNYLAQYSDSKCKKCKDAISLSYKFVGKAWFRYCCGQRMAKVRVKQKVSNAGYCLIHCPDKVVNEPWAVAYVCGCEVCQRVYFQTNSELQEHEYLLSGAFVRRDW